MSSTKSLERHAFEAGSLDLQDFTQLLELAVLVAVAMQAVGRMVGQHQFVQDLARLAHPWRIGPDDHARR